MSPAAIISTTAHRMRYGPGPDLLACGAFTC
jgi:hypothetical protein